MKPAILIILMASMTMLTGCMNLTRNLYAIGSTECVLDRVVPQSVVVDGQRAYPAKRIREQEAVIVQFATRNRDAPHAEVFLRAKVENLDDIRTKPNRFANQDAIGPDDIVWTMMSHERAITKYATATEDVLIWQHPLEMRGSNDVLIPGQKFPMDYADGTIVTRLATMPFFLLTIPLDIISSPIQVVYDALDYGTP